MFDTKDTTQRVVNSICATALSITGDAGTAGGLILLIHTMVVTIIFYWMLWSDSKVLIYIGFVLWISIIAQHLFFKGCWGVRCERHVWKTKDWYGPWTSLFSALHKLGMPNKPMYHNFFFYSFAILATMLGLDRIRHRT